MRWMSGGAKPGARSRNKRDRAAALARERAMALRLRPLMRAGAAAGVLAAAIGGPFWLWQSGWAAHLADHGMEVALGATAGLGLSVQEVLLEGRANTARDELMAAVAVKRGEPLLGFDIGAMRRRIEAVPWVHTAIVERRLPDMLYIRIVERVPMALWQRDGRLMLVDRDGMVLADDNLGRYRNLLLVIGEDAPREVPRLLRVLATQPAMQKRVVAATRIGARRWNLRLDNGVDVSLPEGDPFVAWTRLAEYERQHKLSERGITAIDLRLPDRVTVRPRDEVRGQRKGGKDA
ncbi:MAG: cell division protein FtsQ/DivIB [Rhodospirillales bacterium]